MNSKLTNSYSKVDNRYTLPGVVSQSLCELSLKRPLPFGGESSFLAVFSSSLTRAKGAHHIINIAHKFKGRIKFVISGSGPLLTELIESAKHCDGDVEVVGYLDRKDLDKLLTSADILINCHEQETSGGILPFKLIEYLAAGGIVITTKDLDSADDVFNFCEITYPNDSALTDSLEKVIANQDVMVERAKKGQSWAISRYSVSAVADSIHNLMLNSINS